jgi:tetratricopeptide (TPR) repeat protein
VRDATELYAQLPQKVQEAAKPKIKPVTYDIWHRMVYNSPSDMALVNRQTAPWYVSSQEKECLFMTGFFLFMNGKYPEAKKHFDQVANIDADIAIFQAKDIPNVLMRLQGACKQGYLVATPEEMKIFKGKNKLRIMFADLEFILSKFEEAEKLYREVAEEAKLKPEARVTALVGVANCLRMLDYNTKAAVYYRKALKVKGVKRCQAEAGALYSYGFLLHQEANPESQKEGLKLLERCYRKYPDTGYGESALFHLVLINGTDQQHARNYAKRYRNAYPQGKYLSVIADVLSGTIQKEISANKPLENKINLERKKK